MNKNTKSVMGNIYSQIFYCILFGHAGMFISLFMFTVVFGVIDGFDLLNNEYIFLAAFGSVSFYISWIMGVSSTVFDKLNHFWRGVLSTLFFNCGVIWHVESHYGFEGIPYVLILILFLNVLIAVYGSQKCETLANTPMDGTDGEKGQMLTVALGMPIPIVAFAWLIIVALIKLGSL